MKLFGIIFSVASIFVAASNAGSPSQPKVCDVVLKITFEFTSFTSDLLRLYILNTPRSDDFSNEDKSGKLDGLIDVVQRNDDVPEEDKVSLNNLISIDDGFGGRSLADQLTRANIWDCFVEIFTGGLSALLAP